MKQFLIQCLKDFKANFSNFNAYIIIGGYCLLSFLAAIYLGDYFLRESNVFNSYFIMQPAILMLIIPAITMKSWADEIKSGTIELLLAQPISYTKLVLAKFFAAYSFFCVMILFSVPFCLITNKLTVLDVGAVRFGYVGVLLCGALFTAAGCLVSAFNRNNILSYISTILLIFVIMQFEFDAFYFRTTFISLHGLNFEYNYNAFLSGVLYWGNVCYFVLGIVLLLWLNVVVVKYKKMDSSSNRRQFIFFVLLVWAFFASTVLSISLISDMPYDATDSHKFTLMPTNQEFLKNTDKKINIALYEAKNNREDANSKYAVYAEFVEKMLKLIEYASRGAVRVEFIRVEPFSTQERSLIRRKIPFEEDSKGNKTFMVADFSDNDGNSASITSFSSLRQDLLENDIMRIIRRFGLPKKEVLIIANSYDREDLSAFESILQEFYNVTFLEEPPIFIPKTFDATVVIDQNRLSSEFLLAMEQYVFNGGNLLIFNEPNSSSLPNDKVLGDFLNNYGIEIKSGNILQSSINTGAMEFGAALPATYDYLSDVRSVLVSSVGEVNLESGNDYSVDPILYFNQHVIGAVSTGYFISNFLELSTKIEEIEPGSVVPGRVFFFYDTDILKNNIYISEESKGSSFYELIPLADNLLFFLRLLDFATGENIERLLPYRHYTINVSSIGNAIFNNVNEKYADVLHEFEKKIETYQQKQISIQDTLQQQGFASVKNIGDISHIAQTIDETQDELNHTKAVIADEAQTIVVGLTLLLVFVIPGFLLLMLAITIILFKKYKSKKIRRLIDNA